MNLENSKKLSVLLALVICASCISRPKASKEELQTAEYLQSVGEILADYQEKLKALKVEASKATANFDSREQENPRVATLDLADSMQSLLEQTKPYISRLELLTPPERLREHQAVS
ncbi:MAG TPA: hypothetical protein VK747_04580, partial [Blastocatellia bacterium]|nr:hypothetical protein [Blastocatellia bacterium]